MKQLLTIFLCFISIIPSLAQFEERFEKLAEANAVGYTTPFVTTLGTAMNSSTFYTAALPDVWGFSISFRGMYILIPEDQKTFTPVLPDGTQSGSSATIYGSKGGAFFGPNGSELMPPGLDLSGIPVGFPQIALSILGSEIMLRYLPEISVGDDSKVSLFGIGLKHSISRYIPLLPVDIAAQFLYSNFEVTNLMKISNIAFNAHASKTFGVITPYFGLQYESSTLDLNYTFTTNTGGIRQEKNISASIDGDNNFRATFGASLKLAVLVLNADVSLSSQTVLSGGLSFEF